MKVVLKVCAENVLANAARGDRARSVSFKQRWGSIGEEIGQRIVGERATRGIRSKGIGLYVFQVGSKFQGMKPLGIEEVVIALPRTIIELKGLGGANTPRKRSERSNVYAASRLAWDKDERSIGGELVDGRVRQGLRGLIEQNRSEDAILIRKIVVGADDKEILAGSGGAYKNGL